MCISIVFSIKPDFKTDTKRVKEKVQQLVSNCGYGCAVGSDALFPKIEFLLKEKMPGYLFFEIHDLPESHCACDIDEDIRVKAKLGEKSQFFNLINDILELDFVEEMSVLFTYNDFEEDEEIREENGGFGKFFERLNRWNTWQVEGYDPNRNRYYIVESSPYLYTFVNNFTN